MFLKIQESVPVVNCGKGKPGPCADGESPVADDKESMEVRTPKQVVDAMKEKMSKIPIQKLVQVAKKMGIKGASDLPSSKLIDAIARKTPLGKDPIEHTSPSKDSEKHSGAHVQIVESNKDAVDRTGKEMKKLAGKVKSAKTDEERDRLSKRLKGAAQEHEFHRKNYEKDPDGHVKSKKGK